MQKVTGVLGISGGELARYAISYHSILRLQVPPGTICIPARGSSIAENRNGIASRALDAGAEWVFYADDDQVFFPDTLTRLLVHDKDIISGLYVKREIPFVPHIYDREDENGWLAPHLLTRFDGGLMEFKSVAAGCLVVKTAVLRAMTAQGLAGSDGKKWWNLGQMKGAEDNWGDDHNFCQRARQAGFKIWCDLDVRIGHEVLGTVYPKRNEDGSWTTIMMQGDNQIIAEWPAAQQMPALVAV